MRTPLSLGERKEPSNRGLTQLVFPRPGGMGPSLSIASTVPNRKFAFYSAILHWELAKQVYMAQAFFITRMDIHGRRDHFGM